MRPGICPCAAQGLLTYTLVPVNREGLVSVEDVAAALTPHTVLISLMHSNNEVGSIQPVAQVAALAAQRGVLLHSDAAQSLGKVPVSAPFSRSEPRGWRHMSEQCKEVAGVKKEKL